MNNVFPDMSNVFKSMAQRMVRETGKGSVVWCRICGRSQPTDPAVCLAEGWPKCHNATMSIDPPHEWGTHYFRPEEACQSCGVTNAGASPLPTLLYRYVAKNQATSEVVEPLCGPCIRGDTTQRFIGPPWKHDGGPRL